MHNTHIRTLLCFLLLFLSFSAEALAQSDHLEPFQGWGESHQNIKKYYTGLFSLLHKEFSDTPFARYTVCPSFSSEYALSVEETASGCYLMSRSLSENYWYAQKRESVTVDLKTCKIEAPLYLLIGELFTLVTEQIEPIEKDSFGTDGTTYYFAKADSQGNVKIGETWSPKQNSLMSRLVNICNGLYALSRGEDVSHTQIEENVRSLITEMRK